ncbi:MAG: hypothetical protein ACOCQB_03460 [Halanaerobiaceae bacterium]
MLKLLVTLANKLTFRQAEEVIKDAGFPSLSHATIHKEVRCRRILGEIQYRNIPQVQT